MNQDSVWIGLDLGFRKTRLCIVDALGHTLVEQDCETNLQSLSDAMSAFSIDRIALIAAEAGSDTHMIRKLRDAGYPATLFESRKASRFLAVRKNKTDASDAKGLADLARLGRHTISQVHLKSLECQQLRSQLAMRKKLVLVRVTVEGIIRSFLRLYGRPFKSTMIAGGIRKNVIEQLKQIKLTDGVDLTGDLAPLLDMSESLRAYLRKLDHDLDKLARSLPVCRLLMEVPGVGPNCALSFYSAVEDPQRFKRSTDVGAYLGLVPRRYQSGEYSRTFGITKTGSKMTRTHLVTSATIFGTHAPDCALKEWYVALRERIGSKRARVALARKLGIVLLIMWKQGRHFEPYPARNSSLMTA